MDFRPNRLVRVLALNLQRHRQLLPRRMRPSASVLANSTNEPPARSPLHSLYRNRSATERRIGRTGSGVASSGADWDGRRRGLGQGVDERRLDRAHRARRCARRRYAAHGRPNLGSRRRHEYCRCLGSKAVARARPTGQKKETQTPSRAGGWLSA